VRFGFVGGTEPAPSNRPARRGDGTHLGESVSAFVDGRLDGGAGRRAEAHLAGCPDCQREVAEYRALKNRLTALASPEASQALSQRLLQLADPGFAQPIATVEPGGVRPVAAVAVVGALPGRRLRHPMLLLSASALVLGAGGAFFVGGSGPGTSSEPVVTPPTTAYLTQHLEVSEMLPASDPVAHYNLVAPLSLLPR
jgi:anti-sigma factor RsiW